MAGQIVEFRSNGGTASGYFALPPSGSGPAVVVIQEWWGLVDHIKDVADRFAFMGFVALAPDMYHGQKTEEPDEAGKLMMALNIDQAAKDLAGAVSYLLARPETTSRTAAAIGFCMGGQLALYAAAVAPGQVSVVADFYGVHPSVKIDYSTLKAAVCGTFAENDTWAPPQVAADLEAQIKAGGAATDFKVYKGAEHGFFNDTRPSVYHAAYTKDAWERTLDFFRAHLA